MEEFVRRQYDNGEVAEEVPDNEPEPEDEDEDEASEDEITVEEVGYENVDDDAMDFVERIFENDSHSTSSVEIFEDGAIEESNF